MTKKRTIAVYEDGNIIYKGDDKRYYNRDYPRCAMGIPLFDWAKAIIYIIGIIVFIVKADSRLRDVEKNTERLTALYDNFADYMKSSDVWHSAATGDLFKNGKPIDGKPIKNFNTGL